MAKRILIFSLAYYPKHVGGAEIAIKEITDRIDPHEIKFDMVCLRFNSLLPKTETIGNVTVYRIGFSSKNPTMADIKKFPLHLNKFFFQFLAAWKAHRLYQKNRYDGIWAMMAHSCGVPATLFKLFHPQVSYLLTLQEGDPPEYIQKKMRLLYPLFKRAFTEADFMQTISTFLANWARRMGYQGPLEVIPNAVNTEYFSQQYSQVELNTLKKKLGKKDDDIFIITTSRLVPKNGIEDVIESLQFLPENYKFLILGIGPLENELKLKTKNLRLETRVLFLGQIDHKEMPKYLKISDIFIRPSLSEGMGNSFIEAMAAGIPVIATQEGGIADFLFDPDRNPDKEPTGLAVNVHDPQGIVRQVKRYAADTGLKERIISNARRLVFAKYDWDKIARDMKGKVFSRFLGTLSCKEPVAGVF
jgi:glycosyltransferase involved in cell wall biosynthesis